MIEAFKLLGRIALEGGDAVLRTLTGIEKEADSSGNSMQQMGSKTDQAGKQAARAINETGSAVRKTATEMTGAGSTATRMGESISSAGEKSWSALSGIPKELRSIRKGLGEMDVETTKTFSKLVDYYRQADAPMKQFNNQLVQSKMNWLALGVESKNFQGTNAQFMAQVVELGAKEKAINDARMKANQTGKMAILQQVGAMANLSSQASKITSIYQSMNNPLLNVNQTGLAVANSLNKMAMMGTAAAIALKQLGPNADMKQLQDRIGVINQGIMRMGMVALAAGVTLVGFTALMAKAAIGPDPAKTRQGMAEIKAEYDKALQDRTNELYNWASIFQKVEIKVPSPTKMLDALSSQVEIFKKWSTNLQTLTQRGVDEGFIAEMRKMGPKAAGEIQGLVNMSDTQLTEYVNLWREKHFQASTEATRELEGLRLQTEQKINQMKDSLQPLGLSLEKFKSVWATALKPFVEIWGQIAAKVVDVGTKVGEFVNKLNEVSPWITKIAGMFVYLVSVLTLLLSPLAAGIGLFGGLAAAWGALWPLIAPIVTGLGAMSGTVLLVSAGIVALVAVIAIIVKALMDWNEKTGKLTAAWNQGLAMLKENADKFIKPIKDIFNDVMSRIKEVVGSMLKEATAFWTEHGTTVMTAVKNFSTGLLAVWNFLMPAIKFLVEGIIGGIISIFKGFFDIVMGLVKVFSGLFSGDWSLLWEGIKQIIWGVIEVIWGWINVSMFGKIIKGAATFFKSLISSFKSGWETIRLNIMYFVDGAKALFTNLKNLFTSTFTTMKNSGLSIWQSIRGGIEMVLNAIKSLIMPWATKIYLTVQNAFTKAQTITTTIWNAIKSFFMSIFNFLKTQFTNAFKFYDDICRKTFSAIQKFITTIWNAIKTFFINYFNFWKNLFSTSFTSIKTTVTNIFTSVKTFILSVWNYIKGYFVAALKNIIATVKGNFTTVQTTTTNIFNGIKNFLSTIWTNIKNNVTNAATTLKNKVVDAFNNVKSKATSIFNSVRDAITGPIKTAMDKVSGYVEKIKGFFNKMKLTIPKPKVPKIVLKTATKTILKKTFTYPTGFDVQWAAKGGILNRATMIGAGEAGKEMLMPLEGKHFRPVAAMIAEQMQGLGATGTMGASVEIPVILNGREIARAVVSDLDREMERHRAIRRRGI